MRTIKFRCKCKNGAWHYGVPVWRVVGNRNRCYIVSGVVDVDYDAITIETWQEVIPETVGQFTGLLDQNLREIYEGDKFTHSYYGEAIVVWKNGSWKAKSEKQVKTVGFGSWAHQVKVIGNIHEQ